MQIGERVKELRLKNNMSHEELARKAGYKSGSMIKSIEEGTKTPSFSKNKDLAKALGVSVNELLGKEGLSRNEKIVLGAVHGYVNELPESEIAKGVKVFRLIYDSYIGRKAKEELNKIQDSLSLELHKDVYPFLETPDFEDGFTFVSKEDMEKLSLSSRCKIVIKVLEPMYLAEVYFNDKLFSKEEGEKWDSEVKVAVTLLNNILEMIPEIAGSNRIDIYTDSEYLEKGINSWVDSWEKNNWEKSQGGKVSFQKFWKRIAGLKKSIEVRAWKENH